MPFVKAGQQIQVLVVDENPLTRFGILSVVNLHPELHVCEEAADALTACALFIRERPTMVVLDVSLPKGDGIELVRKFSRLRTGCSFVVVSDLRDSATVRRAFQAGAGAFVSKTDEAAELFCALEAVITGRTYLGKVVSSTFISKVELKSPSRLQKLLGTLSDRELHVFRRTARGQGVTAIARELSVSVKTIETHHRRIKEKLKLCNSSQLHSTARAWLDSLHKL